MNKRRKTFTSVWDALADRPEQAAHLQAGADLMHQTAELIQAEGRKQVRPYFFLPATVLRAPRRVRALVRVR